MADFGVTTDPARVGFDADRLARIDRHFEAYVDDGRLPGWQIAICRHDEIAHLSSYGQADIEAGRAVEADTIWRIYSMSKVVTSVAAMVLYEEGAFELTDPIARWIPEFANPQVYVGGQAAKAITVPATEPIRVWHLLTHTAGLTYGFHHAHVTDELYRNAGLEWGPPKGADLAGAVAAWAAMPLAFNPGSEWLYSVATDVVGRLVEIWSGQSLDAFFAERIFGPLDMRDSGFSVPEADHDRLAALYARTPHGTENVRYDAFGESFKRPTRFLGGGGGLVSTSRDYMRFARMLVRGGELDGARLLSPRTVRYMSQNHLPGGADLETFGRPLFAETRFDGVGFGLGLAVTENPAAHKVMSSAGESYWGGMASTAFWVDPAEDLVVTFMTQLMPSSTYPIRSQLRQLVYQALVD
ncbi:MAG TPA: serine hydrolase domain-containing protein [Mycobacteriales bacterium]|nr:serine hydrolase domain-containing protein [Mycobacteriales bacterium]